MASKSKKKKKNTNRRRKRKSLLYDQYHNKTKRSTLDDLQDPFTQSNGNHSAKKKAKRSKSAPFHKKKKAQKRINHNSSYIQPHTKRRRMSQSSSASSTSSLEILNGRNNHNENKHTNNNNNNHHRNGRRPKHKSSKKLSYNLYANALMPDLNGHSSTHSVSSVKSWANPISPLPFHQEKNRKNLSPKSGKKSIRSIIDDRSVYESISRRSKSRSPSPSKHSVVSSKMIEPQDMMVLNLMNKSQQMSIREKSKNAFDTKMKHKKRANKQYSCLGNIPAPPRTFAKKRNKKPKKLKRSQRARRFLNIGTSMLNDIGMNNKNTNKSNDILITDMDKENYQNLMKTNEQKTKQVAKFLNSELAAFVKETNDRKMKKQKKQMIDLTVDNFTNSAEDDMESTDIEILNEDKIENDIEIMDKSLNILRKLIKLSVSPRQKRLRMNLLKMSPGRKIQSQFIAINIKQAVYQRKKLKDERQRMYEKSKRQLHDDLYNSKRFGMNYNAKDQETQRIMKKIEEYKRRKDAEEKERQRLKEEAERLRKEQEAEALKLQQNEERLAMEQSKEQTNAKRDNKLCPLSQEEEDLIDKMFELPSNKIVGSHKGHCIEVRVKDLNTLEHGQWLNDEVMNFYMALLQDRNIKRCNENEDNICVLLMNTFFFTKLSSNSYNYKAVKRWTKKIKLKKKGLVNTETIFELDKFIFPVHVNKIHWCCGCINFKAKKFEYYDSMNGSATTFFRVIRRYLEDEYKDKLKGDKSKYALDLTEWTNDDNKSQYPQQQNGVDCGVFTSKCADWISDDLYPDYSQSDMEYFRNRMIVEIIRGKTQDFDN